jgi:hypothetical protein
MVERAISQQEVEEAHRDPDITYPGYDGAICFSKEIRGRKVKVVLVGADVVKTVIDESE